MSHREVPASGRWAAGSRLWRAGSRIGTAALVVTAAACSTHGRAPAAVTSSSSTVESSPIELGGELLVGAGEIGGCTPAAEQTALLVDAIPDATVATFGGHALEPATADFYTSCYGPAWGRHLERGRPAAGKSDLAGDAGAAYYAYFGDAAGPAGAGWYSYDIGAWHIVVLNSDCDSVGCKDTSEQVEWLRTDLAASNAACVGAYWEKPRFSSGSHGNTDSVQDFWEVLHDYGAEFVLNGYDTGYERFGPQDPVGVLDPANGIREFVVGTGGAPLAPFESIQRNSEVRDATSWGVLQLTLRDGSYSWEFLPVAGGELRDRGTAICSGAAPSAATVVERAVATMAASEDDAEEHKAGRVSVDSTDLEMILDGDKEQTVGLRFPSVEIPIGKRLLEAYVQFVAATPSTGDASFRITADVGVPAAPFTTVRGDLSRRTTSEAFVTWAPANWAVGGEVGPAQRTPDLSRVIAEVIDGPSWRSGDPITLLLTGSGLRIAQSFDRAPNRAPVLHLVLGDA
ncbi:MAG: hypothetical protein AB7Q42_18555 [Acidimicrobiia bacterium]